MEQGHNIPASAWQPRIMYVDMNSYFASCEQQANPDLRNKPIGVTTHDSPYSCVIAPSIEAKRRGVKTGMRLNECKLICPEIIQVTTHPQWYRKVHIDIMRILQKYCWETHAKSIDEAVADFSSYKFIYTDLVQLAQQIKADITKEYDYLRCSIGIASNTFLAKLGTELQKPNGLIQITPDNIDHYLGTLKLTDLPGIAGRNERRLQMIGIKDPLQMRHTSPALLRKAFGGVVGDYWHRRLNFEEADIKIPAKQKTMSTMRTVSREQRESRQTLESLLIALCTRLEQRMVKAALFCKEASFFIRYRDGSGWDTKVTLPESTQDAHELRMRLLHNIEEYERSYRTQMLTNETRSMGIAIWNFITAEGKQYSLFNDHMRQDIVRKVMYNIKDHFEDKNVIRRGCEVLQLGVMKDAIGFGSVRDLIDRNGKLVNNYLLEEDD